MHTIFRKCLVFLGIVPFFVAAEYIGPPSSSAGVVEREIEEEYEAKEVDPEKPAPSIKVEIPEEKLKLPEGEGVEIRRFNFFGNTVLSSDELEECLKDYMGRKITLQEIYDACAAIQQCYLKKGYFLARAYPPPQDLQSGILTLMIIEGCLNAVIVEGNKHYSTSYIAGYFKRLNDQALNYNDLIAALLLLNENRDLMAGAVLKKGSKRGTVDMVVRVKDERPVYSYIDVNNYGSDPTTLYRSGVRIDAGNAATSGDLLSLTGVIGYPPSGLYFTSGEYSIPINHRGTKVSLSFLYSAFRVNTLTALGLSGVSAIATGNITHPVIRRKKINTDISLSFDYKQIKNLSHDTTTSYDRLRLLTFGAYFDIIDSAKGRNLLDASFCAGIPHFLGGSEAVDPLASRRGSGGRMFILNLDYKRIQQMTHFCFLLLRFAGQYTPNKVPLAQQIYIGGIDTVRGYPAASGLGDYGYFANAELRLTPPWNYRLAWLGKTVHELIQFCTFVDHGGVFLNGLAKGETNGLLLTSGGVGARIFGPYNLTCNLDLGFPLTDRPQSSIPGQATRLCFLYFKLSWQWQW